MSGQGGSTAHRPIDLSASDISMPRVDSDGFITPRGQVKQQMRSFRQEQKRQMMAQRQHQPPKQGRQVPYDRKQRQGVVGEACDTGISSAPASREFFITYVTKECDEAKMKQHINSHGITE